MHTPAQLLCQRLRQEEEQGGFFLVINCVMLNDKL